MRHTAETLTALGVACEKDIVFAHRTPDRLFAFAKRRPPGAGIRSLSARRAGGERTSAGGMKASLTNYSIRVFPSNPRAFCLGVDSLYSIVQDAGRGFRFWDGLAIGKPGAINAGDARRQFVLGAERIRPLSRQKSSPGANQQTGGRFCRVMRPGGVLWWTVSKSRVKLEARADTIWNSFGGGNNWGRMAWPWRPGRARLGACGCQVFSPDPDSPGVRTVRAE